MIRPLLFAIALLPLAAAFAQAPHCAAQLGGHWFINCKSLVSYNDQDVVSFSNWADPVASVNLDVYGTDRKLQARVRNGKLVDGKADRFTITTTATEFTLVDASTTRVICILKEVPPTTAAATCQVDVWLDLYVPGTGYFHCDPSTSNDAMLTMLGHGTFKNNLHAIKLH